MFFLAPPAPLLALALLLPAPSRAEEPHPAPERVKAAVTELKDAFAKNDAGPRIRAIEGGADVADAEVVGLVARGLDDRDVTVQKAAIEALRFNPHKKALEALQARARQKAAKEDLTVYAALIRAVGQHGSPSSIEILTENPWSTPDAAVLEAKILGLGRIRTNEAVKAVIDLMEIAGPQKIEPFMPSFRLALWSLTGTDQRGARELWLRWYRDNKSKLKVAAEPATEPPELARRWQRYWAKPGAEEAAETGKRRER
jgi:hypothetical protein